ncbi:hypothetical protein SAMN05216215_1018115 [Saccharopolyspora shandongensis]|uniref:Uncharacterized protein n=1 Tax=Saccharopolyspora shandongensis TaxID=418495 RepID=A0A1H3GBH3_9PSEU|nr:hypothetical protein [Saccharopolyspora shandongensis]SDY00621.1 hypothetical protein SAMN05216215_1018115 [Saccharopolyspora shandongensis]
MQLVERLNQIRTQMRRELADFDQADDQEARTASVEALIGLTEQLLAFDDSLPEYARQQAKAAAQAKVLRVKPAMLTAAGICAAAGLLVTATVFWGSTPGIAILGSLVSLLLGFLLFFGAEETEVHTANGPKVPSPTSRWAAAICGALSAVAFVALAWGWTGGWFGWLALLATGVPAFLVALQPLNPPPSTEAASSTAA